MLQYEGHVLLPHYSQAGLYAVPPHSHHFSPDYLNDSSVPSTGSSWASCLAGLSLFVFVSVVSILCRVGRIKVTEAFTLTALGGFSHLFDVKIIP